jgi:hypothetical protein
MVKLFESKFFNIALPITFFILLVLVFFYGYLFGISDTPTLIANSLLMLMATLIAISLPLYAARKAADEEKKKEDERVYIAVAMYVGTEIIDNMAELQNLIEGKKRTEGQMEELHAKLPWLPQQLLDVGRWAGTTEELIVSLEDKQHQNLSKAGLIAKIPNTEIANDIMRTYQEMSVLIRQARRLNKFCMMMMQEKLPKDALETAIKTQFAEGKKVLEVDIEIFMKQADKTVKAINSILKPYRKKLSVSESNEQKD